MKGKKAKEVFVPPNERGIAELDARGIPYTSSNGGVQLRIGDPVVIHFWPSTQRWNVAGSPHNDKGIENLVTWLKKNHPTLVKET